jgi:ABC-type transport system involved in multi-copper enzyme maturation permease subunit
MIWLTWRQFRTQAIAALAVLAAATAYFVVNGLGMHHAYAADLASCASSGDCGIVLARLQADYTPAFDLAEILLAAAPALIGIFWGAPLIGRELETGTHQVAWNQSVTRTRWLAIKLVGVGVAAMVTAGALSYLLTWWAGPLDQINGNRFGAMTFSTRDIVPLAYAAFAFALGTMVGLLLRRTIPAMAVTLAVFIGIQVLVPTTVRPNLLPSSTVTFAVNQSTLTQANGIYSQDGADAGEFYLSGLSMPQGAWVLSTSPVENSSGKAVPMSSVQSCLPGLRSSANEQPFVKFGACVAHDDLHESVTYQPSSHYWPLQWFEAGIFLVLTALLSGACFWWIRRRRN